MQNISSPVYAGTAASPATCNCQAAARRSLSWGAIFAGLSAALALQVLFMMLGAGLGLAIYSPATEANPVANFGAGAAIVQGISAVLSLWLGGWVAGRFTPVGVRATGWLHGFGVWCAATVAGVLFVATGAGWVLGDLSKLVGGGLSLAGQPAAAVAGGAADLAKEAATQSSLTVTSFVDEAMGRRPTGSAANLTVRAKREIGLTLARLFNPAQQGNLTENRAAAARALVDHGGLSAAEAETAITEWTASYERMKADLAATLQAAETKAREAAETAAKALAVLSLGYFLAFLLGAGAATYGGNQGAAAALRCEARTDSETPVGRSTMTGSAAAMGSPGPAG